MAQVMKVTFPMDLSPAHYAALGEIAARWSWIEFHFHVVIRTILKLDIKQARIVTIGMAIKPMGTMIRGLSLRYVKDTHVRRDLQQLVKDILASKNDRDTYVHGVYCSPKELPQAIGIYYMRSAEERILPTTDPLPATKLRDVATLLRTYQERLTDIIHRLKALP